MKKEKTSMELCLNCLVQLEDAGFSAQSISTGMVVCDKCGRQCWGGAYRMSKGEEREA